MRTMTNPSKTSRIFLRLTTSRAVYTEERFLNDLDFCPPGVRP